MSASGSYGTGGTPVGPVVETLTGNTGGPVGPTANNINIIGSGGVNVAGNPGTSTLTITVTGVATLYTEDTGTAAPSGGNLNIFGGNSTAGKNIHTTGSGSTVSVILNDSLLFPSTNASGTMGVLFFNGDPWLHNYNAAGESAGNTFVGRNSGNFTSTGGDGNVGLGPFTLNGLTGGIDDQSLENVAVGNEAGMSITIGSYNVCVGAATGESITSGTGNICIGLNSGKNFTSGARNLLIGPNDDTTGTSDATGFNYTTSESDNILLNNVGVITESHTIRIGTDGSAAGQQNAAYFAGVYNRTFASPSGVVQIDHNFKLGSSAGTNGQLLIGATGASPAWANLTSVGASIVITNGANSINIEATGTGAGASAFPTDSGTANEAAGVLNIFSGATTSFNNMNTTGSGNTVRVRLNDSISLPNTNTGGTTGLYSLGGNKFLHNYGSGNTWVGSNAGNLTLTTGSAINNCALGSTSLTAITTGSENCVIGEAAATNLTTGIANTALGFGSLDNLTTGQANTCVGVLAGSNYTSSETNNILLGNFGTVGESATIRIGRNGVHTSAFMSGVYNASIGTTNSAVFIDNTGKLGTKSSTSPLNGSSFMVVNASVETLPNSGTQTYLWGTNQAETILYDNFGVFFTGGSSTPANFTAPIAGFYQFTWQLTISIVQLSLLTMFVQQNGTTFFESEKQTYSTTGAGNFTGTFTMTCNIQLATSDVIEFGLTLNGTPLNPILLLGTAPNYLTWATGTLLQAI